MHKTIKHIRKEILKNFRIDIHPNPESFDDVLRIQIQKPGGSRFLIANFSIPHLPLSARTPKKYLKDISKAVEVFFDGILNRKETPQ